MAYQILVAQTPVSMAQAIYTASLSGWLVIGGIGSSGSSLIQLMGIQDSLVPSGSLVLGGNLIAVPASSFPSSALPQGQFSWPPETGIPGIGSVTPT